MSSGQDEHLFYVLIILGVQCTSFNREGLAERPQKWLLPDEWKIPAREDAGKGASLQLCNAKSMVPHLPRVSLKPVSELIHEAMWAEISPSLWLETQFLYSGRKESVI